MQRTIDQPCPAPFYCFIWSWWLKSKLRDGNNYGETFPIVLLCVPCASSFFSWQALAEALKQNSTLTNLNLACKTIGDEGVKACVCQEWCHEGRGSEEIQRKDHDTVFESHVREIFKKQFNAALFVIQISVNWRLFCQFWHKFGGQLQNFIAF